MIIVSGGFWTGSGALIAMLNQYRSTIVLKHELSMFSYGQLFKAIGHIQDFGLRDDNSKDLINLVWLWCQFDKQELSLPGRLMKYGLSKLRLYPRFIVAPRCSGKEMLGNKYAVSAEKTRDYLLSLARGQVDFDLVTVRSLFADVLSDINANFPEDKLVICDQLISPPYYKYFQRYCPIIPLYYVSRNVYDQYTDLRMETFRMVSNKIALGLEAAGVQMTPEHRLPHIFIRDVNSCINNSIKECQEIIPFEFEDLVENYPNSIASVVRGLNLLDIDENNKYSREKSLQNIGIWRNGLSDSEKQIILKL